MALFGPVKIGDALSALNAVTDEVGPDRLANINELTFFYVGSAGISAGAVQAEEAHVKEYAGTWAPNGSPVTVPASTVKTVKVTGVSFVARGRISTGFVGGTVDVYVMGR